MMGIAQHPPLSFSQQEETASRVQTHPPIYGRWSATVQDVNLPEDDWFWLYFSSFALALLKYHSLTIQPKIVKDYKSLCFDLIANLENGI